MKRLLFICALAAISASAFAQAKNVKKVKAYIENAIPPLALDLSNAKPEMIQEYRELLEPALTNPESKDLADTWRYASRLRIHDMNVILKRTGGKFGEDKTQLREFINNQRDIVSYLMNYERLMHVPNEKGKLPYKEEEMSKEHMIAQQAVMGPRANLIVGASQFVYDDPAYAVELLKLYNETFDHPLFKEKDLRKTDENQSLANFIYATALKTTGGDEAEYLKLFEQSLEGENGPLACQELITHYKNKGDKANQMKYLNYAAEHFPKQLVFGMSLIQEEIVEKNYDKAVADADKLIAAIESDEALKADETAHWPYYFKAVALYNSEKHEEAYNAFLKAYEFHPDFDNLNGAANCAAQLAQHNANKKDVAKAWYDKAISHFEQCRTDFPDKSDVWGYQLYVCYNNTGNNAKAAQFKKYAK
jgi:tetratricopeptide (TPR) repeat protein